MSQGDEFDDQAANNVCTTCGNTQFEASDGLFFCVDCGTQSQDVREEVAEETEHTGAVRTYKSSTVKKKKLGGVTTQGRVPFVEKIQLVLKLQCEALVKLGFDESVKDAVRCLSLIYLRHFGYAFQDKDSLQAPPTQLAEDSFRASTSGAGAIPKRPPLPSQSRKKRGLKRSRDNDDDGKSPGMRAFPDVKKTRLNHTEKGKDRKRNCADFSLASDSCLFEDAKENVKDCKNDEERLNEAVSNSTKLHKYFKKTKRGTVCYLSIRLTISLLYLGLLFSEQNVLLTDFSRWVATNKIPFHNLHMLLPAQYMIGTNMFQMYGRFRYTSKRIHSYSFLLWRSMPLPPLPSVDLGWTCHALLDRLALPLCFHSMLDHTLSTVYLPCQEEQLRTKVVPFTKRVDVECMAVIIVLIKLMYRLDDKYEFDMADGPIYQGEEDGRSLYLWEDWVPVFCRAQQKYLDRKFPLTARDLEYVSSYENYLDFCRNDLFPEVRPVKDKGKRHYVYNPERFAKVAAAFGQHLRHLRSAVGTGGEEDGDCEEEKEAEEDFYNWDSFVPRRVPLDVLESGDGGDPWSRYLATPETENSRTPGKEFSFLSDSMVLLLQLCSDVVDVEATKLLLRVKYVEWTIIFAAEAPIATKITPPSESSSFSDEDSSDEEDSSDSECSSSFLSDFSCTCSECGNNSSCSSSSRTSVSGYSSSGDSVISSDSDSH